MRLALLIDSLEFGGSESVIQRLALQLAGRGHRVLVYCLRDAAADTAELKRAGVTVRELHARPRELMAAWRLGSWLRRDAVDLVHAHCCAGLVWALPATRLLGLPLVHVWHGWPSGRLGRDTRLALALDRYVSRVGINAESLRARLPADVARTAVCVPNGLDCPPADPAAARRAIERLCGRPLRGPVLLSVANVRAEKDQRGLLRALAAVRERWPGVALVNVGLHQEAEYWEAVRRDVAELGLAGAAYFPGPCPEAWRLSAGADVFVLNSTREGLPNAVLEAMSQRVPIVATAVGEIGRLDGSSRPALLHDRETALLVPAGRPDALADALAAALRDRDGARARAVRAFEHYRRNYTAVRMADRYEALYRAAMGRGRRPAPSGHRGTPARRPAVLMLGPPPSAIGGMVTSVNVLMAGPLRESFALHRHATPLTDERRRTPDWSSAAGRTARLICGGLWHAANLLRLARTLAERQIELVHIHTCSHATFWRNLADIAVARLMQRRVVLHIRGGRFAEFCETRGRAGRWLVRRGLAAADALIVLSEQVREALRPFTGRVAVHVIPNAVAAGQDVRADPRRTRRAQPCRFLYLAALTHAKGLRDLLAAAAELAAEEVRFELTVAGPAPEAPRSFWEARAAELGLSGRVRFAEPVDARGRAVLFRQADVFVHPSHSEALPNAVLEAAAAGLPVVATAVGSLPELLAGDGGAAVTPLVAPRDPKALAAEMRRLATSARLRRAIGARLRARVLERCDVRRVSEQIGSVYCTVLARQPHAAREPRSLGERLVRRLTYPAYERLRGRPTLRELRDLERVVSGAPAEVARVAAERLGALLRFAGRTLPYYQEVFAARGVNANAADPLAELAKLPVLEKSQVRAHAARLTWPGVPGGLLPCVSGGTSGDTLHFHVDRLRHAQSMAARLWAQGLFGVRPGDRRMWLWGSPLEVRESLLRRWRDALIHERVLDAFDLPPGRMDEYLRRIKAYRPRLLIGYTSAVALLAQHARGRYGRRDFPDLRVVVLTGDEVLPEQRALIGEVFGCAVASEYGSREVGLIGHDCPLGRLHVVTPHVLVEVLRHEARLPAGRSGYITCTNLNTRAQPLIRYHLGDVGRFAVEACPCGLPLPVLEVQGARITGFVALPGGKLCHGHLVAYLVRVEPCVVAFKVYQRRLDAFEVLLVVDDLFRPEVLDRLRGRFRESFGPQVSVEIRLVDEIPPDPSGKRRHVVSDVAPEYREFEVIGALTGSC